MVNSKMRVLLSICIIIPFLTIQCRCVTVTNANNSFVNKSKDATATSSTITNVNINATETTFSASSTPSEKQVKQTSSSSTSGYDTMQKLNLIKEPKQTTPTPNPEKIVSTYRVNNSDDGSTCILMTVDALLSFIYPNKLNHVEKSDVFVPAPSENNVILTGDCSSGERSDMLLKWKSFVLNFDFAKSPGGERWFVNGIQLSFNTKESTFKQPLYTNTDIQVETIEGNILFPTPVGRSFKCRREIEVSLYSSDYLDLKVKLSLRKLTLEPFIFKNDEFGPEYFCAAAGAAGFRSDTAPFIFGSLLILASLGTIGGYAAYRYVKVNKVQYDAME